jgi:hypothetical protein
MKQLKLYPALDFCYSSPDREEEFLALFSRVSMAENMKNRSDFLFSKSIDWDRFLMLAGLYMVKPLVYKHLQVFKEYVPEYVLEDFRKEAGRVFAQSYRDFDNIRFLTDIFNGASVETLFIKGASFVLDVYDEKGIRPFCDIDVLIREKDFLDVDKALKKKGFVPCEEEGKFNQYRSQKLYSWEGKVYLDVHRSLIGRKLHSRMLNVDDKEIWGNKRKLFVPESELYTLDLVHTLLYQCLHLAMQHSFSGLRWYVDIHEFLNKYKDELDWEKFIELAELYKIQRPVYYVLLFTDRMLGANVPNDVMKKLSRVERKVDFWVFNKIRINNAETDYLAELFMFDKMSDTVKFVFKSIVTYPQLIKHFLKLSFKVIKQMFSGKRKAAVSS